MMQSDAILPSSPPRMDIKPSPPSSPLFSQQENVFSLKSSSPPPLFSSDDSRDSVDVTNYESPRIFKNKRKGTWWDNHDLAHRAPESKKSKISRNFDSGVYMMSDATDSSEDILPQHKSPFAFEEDRDENEVLNEPETEFNRLLRAGLERNCEWYEFGALDLRDDDISQIGNLTSIIKNPPDPGHVLPEEGQYRSMVPELFVDLSQNSLCQLTPSMFNIQTLTTLIIRNNQIRELPQQIGQLRNLMTLDVSLNQLTVLPFEIVHLFYPRGSLVRCTTMGNPLLEPMPAYRLNGGVPIRPYMKNDPPRDDLEKQLPYLYSSLATSSDPEEVVWRIHLFESWTKSDKKAAREEMEESSMYEHHPAPTPARCSSETLKYVARSLVCYFDQAGRTVRGSPKIPKSDEEEYSVIVETSRGTYGTPSSLGFVPTSSSRVASLLTTSLHNAFQKRKFGDYSIEDVREMLPTPMPCYTDAIIDRAIENDRGGYGEFRQCHTCQKKYVVPRAEWVEFWIFGYEQVFYPVKVVVCSWGCVPAVMKKRPEKELL